MKRPRYILAILLLACGPALADTVVTRDGIVRVGVIESRNDQEVHLRMNTDGISSVLVIPMSQVSRIVLGGPGAPPTTAATQAPPPAVPASASPVSAPPSAIKPPSEAELAAYASRGFLAEMAASAAGRGLDDPARLPAAEHELWDRAMNADAAGKRGETLDALRLLEAAMRDIPSSSGQGEGLSRLDAIARRTRRESFALWMGRVHWETISGKYSSGQFDLADVREIERPVLIGLMKSQTAAALEPLKSCFPPVDEKTGQPAPFRPAQLSGIALTNALEVKDQSLLAAALLLGQLKLEPNMSSLDRGFLSLQLASVNRILSRARDLEPQARAAIAKAQQDQRIAAEKARRDAALAARKAAMTPK